MESKPFNNMPCDVFDKHHARKLLAPKYVTFVGDSNMRALYKDIIWLLEYGTLVDQSALKIKNEVSYLNDRRISNGTLHNEVTYQEIREYNEYSHLNFMFITRCYADKMKKWLMNLFKDNQKYPDVLIISSSIWDLTRWGSDSVKQYINDIPKLMKFLAREAPAQTRIIWLTASPPAEDCHSGCITDEVADLAPTLPWMTIEANDYSGKVATFFKHDVLDIHYYLCNLIDYRCNDGIHWTPPTMRLITNLLLTHLSQAWDIKLPNNHSLSSLVTKEYENVVYDSGLVEAIEEAIKTEDSAVTMKKPEPLFGKHSASRQKRLRQKRNIWKGYFPKTSSNSNTFENYNFPPPLSNLPQYFGDNNEQCTGNGAFNFPKKSRHHSNYVDSVENCENCYNFTDNSKNFQYNSEQPQLNIPNYFDNKYEQNIEHTDWSPYHPNDDNNFENYENVYKFGTHSSEFPCNNTFAKNYNSFSSNSEVKEEWPNNFANDDCAENNFRFHQTDNYPYNADHSFN